MSNPCRACVSQDCQNCKIRPRNKCGKKTEIFSRVCGYYRPYWKQDRPGFNAGKMEEMKDRKVFVLKEEKAGISPA